MALVEFAMLAAMCAPNVDPSTLQTVVRHESRANIYAIGVNGDYKLPRQPENLKEAVATAQWLKDNGYDFDAGLGQVNVRNLPNLGMSIPDLFEPCKNIKGAATILTDCYTRAVPRFGAGQPALLAALSCYNTGNFERGFKNGYVNKVVANVGLDVPALLPAEGGSIKQPIRLKGETKSGNAKPEARQVVPTKAPIEGIADAFADDGGDAFTTAANEEKATENQGE